MSPNLVEILKLVLITGVPCWLLVRQNHKGVILWLGATFGAEMLNFRLIANVSPQNVVGLLCLPVALSAITRKGSPIAALIRANLLLLIVLGILFGFLFPWIDITGERRLNQLAQGRSVIYLLHTIADISVAAYVARALREEGALHRLFRYLLIGTSIAAAGVLLEWITEIDFFSILVPDSPDWTSIGRLRGFHGEPRTVGQLCTFGLLLLMGLHGLGWKRIPLLVLHGMALAFTASTSALLTLVCGTILLVLGAGIGRWRTLALILVLTATGWFVASPFGSGLVDTWAPHVSARLSGENYLGADEGIGNAIASRLEVFDASALLFLWNNPGYFLFGAGPGLVSLPASAYVPNGVAYEIYGDRIDSVPHMGFFLILADCGIVGIALWFMTVGVGYKRLNDHATKHSGGRQPWLEARSFFLVISGLYLLQASPIWYIFLGVAWGADVRSSAPPEEPLEAGETLDHIAPLIANEPAPRSPH